MGKGGPKQVKRQRHTPEQIIRKLRTAEQMLSEGKREALLSEVIAGAGAGYSCYLVASRATVGPPQWAAGEARELFRVISTAILRSRGIDVTNLIDQGRTVVIGGG
jgi:hypothetical protein